MDPKYVEATRVAQSVLTTLDASFKVDGHWGGFTQKAFDQAPAGTQAAIVAAIGSYNVSTSQLRDAFAAEKLTPSRSDAETRRKLIARSGGEVQQEVQRALENASLVTGTSLSILQPMVSVESNGNPFASNGSSRGLLQVQPAAWAEAADWLRRVKNVVIGTWAKSAYSARDNALAGAAYLQINIGRLKTLGYTGPISPAVLYLAHQQGAGGFIELWKVSRGDVVKTNYVSGVKMSGNPPQDKRGVTTDRKQFFDRWMAVAERKFGK
jgi:hypothetical protein